MVRILSESIMSIKNRMDANLAEMQAKQASADEVKAGLEKLKAEAEADCLAKNELFNTAKNAMKERIDDQKMKDKLLKDLKKDLLTKQEAFRELETAKKELEDVFQIHFKFLIAEPIPEPEPVAPAPEPIVEEAAPAPAPEIEAAPIDEAILETPAAAPMEAAPIEAAPIEAAPIEAAPIEAEVAQIEAIAAEAPPVEGGVLSGMVEAVTNMISSEEKPIEEEKAAEPELPKLERKDSTKLLLAKLKELELEMSCLDTLKLVLKKTPPVSGFDESTIKYTENWMLKQIMGFGQKMTESNGSIESQNIEINAADAACVAAMDERCHTTEDMESAKNNKRDSAEKFKLSDKAIRAHVQEHKEMTDRMIKLNKWVEEFQFCILGFQMLSERTMPLPPPVVEEPLAAEPDVVMAEA